MKRALLAAAGLALAVAPAAPAAAQLRVTKRVDLAAPVKLEPGQGAILVAFRRPDTMSLGKHGALSFARYDMEARDVVFQPKDAKKKGDTTTYWVDVHSDDKKLDVEYHLMPVSAGDYVLYGASPGLKMVVNSFCFAAPAFSVRPGEIVYFGDMTPYAPALLEDGEKAMAMAYSANIDGARDHLKTQPALASGLRAADLRNSATYSCSAQEMLGYVVPGAESLPPAKAKSSEASAGR